MESWLVSAWQRRPQATALITAEGPLTYAELLSGAAAVAEDLHARGLRPGGRAALALPPGSAFARSLHGIWLAGGVAVPLDLRLGPAERAARAAGMLLLDEVPEPASEPAKAQAADWPAPAPEDTAAILYTSGTTAAPKPVPLTFGNFLASALGSAVALCLEREERWLCPMPPVHVGGLSVLVRSAIYATTAVLHERFAVERVLEELSDPERGITLVSLVPTMLARLLEAGLYRPPTLRQVLLGGAPIPPALLDRAARQGVPVAPTYGMSEACSQIATFGWPLPGVEVRLAPDGEILVRGTTVSPAAVAADGWLHTGDVGGFDDRGRLQITGRKAETIVTGGENVAPTEVEAALLEHPAVADAGVYAEPDPEWGEAVVAAVVAVPGQRREDLEGELRAHCRARLAPFKVPKRVRLVAGLPRTGSGKLLRRELAQAPVPPL